MDIEIIKSFTKTSSAVGFSCLVLYLVVENLFKEHVYRFLGSENVFILLLAVLGVIVIFLLHTRITEKNKSSNRPVVNYKGSSTHNGDNRF
jgi:uncharacterized membrane protein YoaK (UPF0700 family)